MIGRGVVFSVVAVVSVVSPRIGAIPANVVAVPARLSRSPALVVARTVRAERRPRSRVAGSTERCVDRRVPGSELRGPGARGRWSLTVLFGGDAWLLGARLGGAVIGNRSRPPAAKRLVAVADGPEATKPTAAEPAPSLMRTELPFGPFLAIAAVFYLFAGALDRRELPPPRRVSAAPPTAIRRSRGRPSRPSRSSPASCSASASP